MATTSEGEKEDENVIVDMTETFCVTAEELGLLLQYESETVAYSTDVLDTVLRVLENGITKEGQEKSGFDAALQCLSHLFNDLQAPSFSNVCKTICSLISLRATDSNITYQIKLCECLAKIVGQQSGSDDWRSEQRQSLLMSHLLSNDANLFEALLTLMGFECSNDVVWNTKCAKAISFMTTLLRVNTYICRMSFKKKINVDVLYAIVKRLNPPRLDVVNALFELMIVSGDELSSVDVISIPSLCPILLDMLLIVSEDLQRYICEKLRVLCATIPNNRIRCCDINLISKILTLLEEEPKKLSPHCIDCLISLMEILGSLSVSPKQLKTLINLCTITKQKKLAVTDRLVQALERMASKTVEQQPRYFFDLYDPLERLSIICPSIDKWNGKGITFHTWICTDFDLPVPMEHRKSGTKIRHMLYSFFSSTGEGFEAFFTREGYLVIGVCTKKEYLTSAVTGMAFGGQEWHALGIVHTKRQLGRSTITVYVDGVEIHSSTLKFPVTDDLIYCSIGYGVKFNPNFYYNIYPPPDPWKGAKPDKFPTTIAAGQQNIVWGEVYMLMGQLCSVCLFKESLSPTALAALFTAGPDNWQELSSGSIGEHQLSSLSSIVSKLVIHYDAKAAVPGYCKNLASDFFDKYGSLHNLDARVCRALSIKDAIQCIGGLPAVFPLLEQVQYVEKEVNEDGSIVEGQYEQHSSMFRIGKSNDQFTEHLIVSNIYDSNNDSEGSPTVGPTIPNAGETTESKEAAKTCTIKRNEKEVKHKQKRSRQELLAVRENHFAIDVTKGEAKTEAESGSSNEHKAVEKRESSDSFLVIRTPTGSVTSFPAASDSWTVIDPSPPKSNRTKTICSWLGEGRSHTLNGVSHFISLIRKMISLQPSAQELLLESKGIEIMGLLLQRCDPRLINIGFLMSIQSLMETLSGVSNAVLLKFHQHILFNFQIWSFSDMSLRIAHIQMLFTCIKDRKTYFRQYFGIDFILNVIQSHYLSNTSETKRKGAILLSEEENQNVRVALLGLVSFYFRVDCTSRDIGRVVQYMAYVTHTEHLNEMVDTVKHLLGSQNDVSGNVIKQCASSDMPLILYRWLVHPMDKKTKADIAQLLVTMATSHNVSSLSRERIRLKSVGFDAVSTLLSKQELNRDFILTLFKLGMSSGQSRKKGVDVFVYYDIVLACLTMVQLQPLPVKLEIARKIKTSVHASKTSAQRCAHERGWYQPLLKLIVKHDNAHGRDPDVMEAELVHTIIDCIHVVMWKGIDGSDLTAWRDRGEPLTALHNMSSEAQFLMPAFVIERELLKSCVETATAALENSVQPWAVDTQNAVQMIKIVEDFLLSSEFSQGASELQPQKWSKPLLSAIHKLVDAMNAWEDSTEGGTEWTEVIRSVERICRTCATLEDKDLIGYSAAQLHMILSRRTITNQDEACYELSQLLSVYEKLKCRESDDHTFVLPVLGYSFMKMKNFLFQKFSVPLYVFDNFYDDFQRFYKSVEFKEFESRIKVLSEQFERKNIDKFPVTIGRFWMDSLSRMSESIKFRADAEEKALQNFSKCIYALFDETRAKGQDALEVFQKTKKREINALQKAWEVKRRFLESERGSWANREASPVHWKLSPTENKSRMRLKLTQNLTYSPHKEAYNVRGNEQRGAVDSTNVDMTMLNVHDVDDEEEDDLLGDGEADTRDQAQANHDNEHLYEVDTSRRLSGRVTAPRECQLITLLDSVEGMIDVNDKLASFFQTNCDPILGSGNDFWFSLIELQELHTRRYNLKKTALEFFLRDRSSYFINFATTKERNTFFREVVSFSPPNLRYSGIKSPARVFRVSGLTDKWVRREISNFDYIMHLNTISGRTYNDLAQYPVFPWVLADYTSEKLDLSNPKSFRDLSWPAGAQTEQLRADINYRYVTFEGSSTTRSHYATHYSNSFAVLHNLVRLEPFTTLHIKLQGGTFDIPDRQFTSIIKAWRGLIEGGDVCELTPEFFYFPEFLCNMNKIEFGDLMDGTKVDDVQLPNWASNAHDFIYRHRQALECDYVSSNLHKWIDLIFGYKQRGEAAVEAINVFHSFTYEGVKETCEFPSDAITMYAKNFGQVPSQLLTTPHPKRKTAEEIAGASSSLRPIFDQLDKVSFTLLELSKCVSPIILLGAVTPQFRSLLSHGMTDPLFTVHKAGYFGIHGWTHTTESISGALRFDLDPAFGSDEVSRLSSRGIPGNISPIITRNTEICLLTIDGKLLICCGFWDNSIRIINSKGKLIGCLWQHNDVVTCLGLDPTSQYFISGSSDLTCMVWEITFHASLSNGVKRNPVQTLYGHDTQVTSVAMSWELDLAVSGSQDGICIIHTLKKGQYVRTLSLVTEMTSEIRTTVTHVRTSEYGRIIVNSKHKDTAKEYYSLTLFSINGEHLGTQELVEEITAMTLVDEFLITGGINNTLSIQNIYNFKKPLLCKNVNQPIRSLFVTADSSHIFVGRDDGNILVLAPAQL